MKFGDKLIELRKRYGYSQEELAEKLGVSRQSVSKWESNNTYPETDKIIQIANLFDCSMDDLINDKITNIESTLRKNKTNFKGVWNSFLEFITKTINMFSKMRFQDGLRCVIEMFIFGLLLSILGKIICGITSSALANIFTFINVGFVSKLREILKGIFHFIWFIIAVIIMVHTFKIRYLNYYEEDFKKDEKKSDKKSEKVVEEKIVVRDEKPFEFLGFLSKIVIIFIKFLAVWILLGIIFGTLGLVFADVVSISLIFANIMFLWSSLLITSCVIFAIQMIVLIICFLFNKKINFVRNIIIFLCCVITAGIGFGLLTLSIKNFNFVDEKEVFNLKPEEIKIEYKDNLVIKGVSDNYKYIIDNSIPDNEIIAVRDNDSKYFNLSKENTSINKVPVVVVQRVGKNNMRDYYDLFVKNIKENKMFSLDIDGDDPLIIKANETTINKLRDNLKRLYLIEEKMSDNEITIVTKMRKVHFTNDLDGEYNALDDTIKYYDDDYSCNKEIEKTEYGERIIYVCNYKEED